ncbi:MAG: hypothetical protein V1492_03625 [Candidatus Micrarchaeota archaeon]
MATKKGQYFSFDAIIASVIFMMAVMMMLGYWHSVKTFLEFQSGDTTKEAMRISSLLFSPSFPQGVGCNLMQTVGFANSWEDKRINQSVIDCMDTQPASWLKQRLTSAYNVTIKVNYIGPTPSEVIIGDEPASNTEVVKIRRVGTVVTDAGPVPATFDIYVYR